MSEKKITSIGGQAVIEGIMMRGPEKTAVAVRKPDGEIIIDEKENKVKTKIMKIPFVRGVFSFVSSMVIGVKALMFSANFYDDEEENKAEGKAKEKAKDGAREKVKDKEKERTEGKKEELSGMAMFFTVAVSLLISIGLFIALPNLIAGFVVPMENASGKSNVLLYNVVESIIKVLLFLGYLVLVSKMKDIQRVFEYHGAEHKTIFCYENGEELNVENVKKFQRFHPRCGTSFLLFVIVISIFIFSAVGRFESKLINLLVRIALLPVIAGISYEIIRFAGRHTDNPWIAWLNKPGMWLQRLTTKEPDESQIEVAIAALKAVLPKDKNLDNW